MNKRLTLLIAAVCCFAAGAFAQGLKSLRINEVMVTNESSIIDEFGHRTGWVELFNANYAPIQISSVFLSNNREHALNPDSENKKEMYAVPLGDPTTMLAKRAFAVFFTDGEHQRGTYHTNFVLTPGQDNWLGIFAADGITVIDSVTVPACLAVDQVWARTEDGAGHWALRNDDMSKEIDYVTPGSPNVIRGTNYRVDDFARIDGSGIGMTLMAMGIVFSALLILCLSFYGLGKIGALFSRINKARVKSATGNEIVTARDVAQDTGEEIAAIVMALHEHLDAHDTESTILTINKVKRAYSPWSSKIYNLREVPQRPTRH